MSYSYLVCDAKGNMATIEVKMFGTVRAVFSMFENEEDALEVGAKIELLSGVPHFVLRIASAFTATEVLSRG